MTRAHSTPRDPELLEALASWWQAERRSDVEAAEHAVRRLFRALPDRAPVASLAPAVLARLEVPFFSRWSVRAVLALCLVQGALLVSAGGAGLWLLIGVFGVDEVVVWTSAGVLGGIELIARTAVELGSILGAIGLESGALSVLWSSFGFALVAAVVGLALAGTWTLLRSALPRIDREVTP